MRKSLPVGIPAVESSIHDTHPKSASRFYVCGIYATLCQRTVVTRDIYDIIELELTQGKLRDTAIVGAYPHIVVAYVYTMHEVARQSQPIVFLIRTNVDKIVVAIIINKCSAQ